MRVPRRVRRLPDGRPGLEQALPADGCGPLQQEVRRPPRHPGDVKQDRNRGRRLRPVLVVDHFLTDLDLYSVSS